MWIKSHKGIETPDFLICPEAQPVKSVFEMPLYSFINAPSKTMLDFDLLLFLLYALCNELHPQDFFVFNFESGFLKVIVLLQMNLKLQSSCLSPPLELRYMPLRLAWVLLMLIEGFNKYISPD